METIREKAYAKLNISLDVSKAREDGYHDMIMVMQTVSLCDDMEIELKETGPIRAESNLPYIPKDSRNLAVKAAEIFLREIGQEQLGAVIRMKKNIPVGAGMAGGSTDAAAVLRALNRHFDCRMNREQLLDLAGQVGSDVAFCVLGGTALAEGRGEVLTSLKPFPDCRFVICKPEYSVSTPELFRALDREKLRIHPDTAGILQAVEAGDLMQICRRMYNVFEDVPDRRMKTIAEIKNRLMNSGAQGAVMTGTGSAVFGVFDSVETAEKALRKIARDYPFACMAEPVGTLI